MDQKQKKLKFFTWEEFEKAAEEIFLWIQKSSRDRKFDGIYGIPRGGWCLAVKLSHLFGKNKDGNLILPVIQDESKITENTIIADDISDSGKQLEKYRGKFIVTIFYRQGSPLLPNAWAILKEKQDERYVVFPWENAKNPT